jgi:heptosyltransferase-3
MRKYCAGRSLAYPLAILDFFVDKYAQWFYKRRKRTKINHFSPKILILSSGHLGDTLILSYLFPTIKKKYAHAEIDLVVGDWCLGVLKDNPYINEVFIINHANTNRKKISKWAKWKDYYKTATETIAKLRHKTYDFSIDIRFSGYPFHWILPFIKVNQTIGFGTRGFGGLLDNEFFMTEDDVHHLVYFKPLLGAIGVEFEIETLEPYFPIIASTEENFIQKTKDLELNQPYIVIFPEAGEIFKLQSIEFWQQLSIEIKKTFLGTIFVCGQTELVDKVTEAIGDKGVGLRDKFRLNELPLLMRNAEKVFCLDSMPAHLSSIFTKTICFSSKSLGISFFPINAQPTICFYDHQKSKNKPFLRKNFKAVFVEKFDNQVITEAVKF